MKIAIFITVVFLLSSCGCDETCQYERRVQADTEAKIQVEREKTAQEERRKQIEIEKAIELAKTPEQRQKEADMRLENEKLEIQRKQLEVAQKQAESLEYLENSRQVHDTFEAVGVGLRVFDALSK